MLVLAGSIFHLRCSMRNLYLWHVETVVMPCENSLVVAWELFDWSMWNIVPWSGLEPRSPPLRLRSLSHWTIKEVPIVTDIIHNMIHLYGINSALTWVVFYAAIVNVHWPFSIMLQFYFYDCIPVDLMAKKKKKVEKFHCDANRLSPFQVKQVKRMQSCYAFKDLAMR